MARYRPVGLKTDSESETTSPGETAPASAQEKSSQSGKPAKRARVGLGWRGWLRWIWRQLTSMRVALMLLLMLAAVALPGAFFPQRHVDEQQVGQYFLDHPDLAPVLDKFHLFDVYTSPWFSAVYLLLFTSLIGCIVPRTIDQLKNLRTPPPRVPKRFARFDVRSQLRTTTEVAAAEAAITKRLGRRYRSKWSDEEVTTTGGEKRTIRALSAERGLGREIGNLVFHLALVGLLIVVAWGQLVHYRGQTVIIKDQTFVNSPLDYNSFSTGSWFDADGMEPFRLRLDDFSSKFTAQGEARDFTADVTLMRPDGENSNYPIKVNHPLATNSTRVYLTGNGYAPRFTITDADGNVAYEGPTIFLPNKGDVGYGSNGVVMVPDTTNPDKQLGFNATLLPTAVEDSTGMPATSAYPELLNPVVVLNLWVGDLGLNDGVPQNLFSLDTSKMTQVMDPDNSDKPLQIVLKPGESATLPNGLGKISLAEDVPRYVALDVRYDPSIYWLGVFAALALAGLAVSLFMPRRRIWARLTPTSGGDTVVTAAALARGDDPGLRRELDRVLAPIAPDAGAHAKEK